MKVPQKIKYTIFCYDYKLSSVGEQLVIGFPEEFVALGHLFNAELWYNGEEQDVKWLKDMFENVLSGKKEKEGGCGDVTELDIEKDFTYVESISGEETRCSIETERLYKLLQLWWDTLRKYHNKEIKLPIEGEF